jgi:L-glutamine-phosphate cytidylyltransferase
MRAIILAAGRGSRMGSMTNEKPKCMTLLSGVSLLDWQLKALREAKIKTIGVVRGYRRSQINISDIFYFENQRWDKTNMLRSLMSADDWLSKDSCIVSYSDIVYPYDTVSRLADSSGDIVICYNTEWLTIWKARFVDPLMDAETFRISDSGKLLEIGNKPQKIEEIEGQYMGLIKFTPSGWEKSRHHLKSLSPSHCDRMDMTTFFQGLIQANIAIETIPIKGKWFEFDNQSDLKAYQKVSEQISIL